MELPHNATHKVSDLKEQLAGKYEVEPYLLKLVFKGKILEDHQKVQDLNLLGCTVMVVVSKPKA